MKIFFIRHAESVNNCLWHQYRDDTDRLPDPPISDLGRQQAAALAAFLAEHRAEFGFSRIYISPFLRTLQTAAAFEALYDCPKMVWKPLHEEGGCVGNDPDTGEHVGAPGMNRAEISAAFPQFTVGPEIGDQGWWNRPEVEPRAERTGRADQVIRHLLAQFGGTTERIALVSHGGFFGRFVDVLVNNIHPVNYWFESENAAISCFSYGPERGDGFDLERWRIEYLNRCEWLGAALRREW